MKKQKFIYKRKIAKFEYREEPEDFNSDLSKIKKLLATGDDSDWKKASQIFLKLLCVRFVPANLNVSQSKTPFKEIQDWYDEFDADSLEIQRFGWNEGDELPWVTYIATIELPVDSEFKSNEEMSEWEENNDYLDVAFTADLEADDLDAFCSSDEGADLYI